MADFNLPSTLATAYADLLDYLKARDVDAISLNTPTNPASGFMRWNRTADLLQEFNGTTWIDQPISVVGGGTGSGTAAGARTNLGLGTIAVQDANNVTITGGSLAGSGAGITNLNASNLAAGTVPLGRLSGITVSQFASALVSQWTNDSGYLTPASNLDATKLVGVLPALNGSNLTNLNGSAISSGTVAPARLGPGSGGATKFLREDGSWQIVPGIRQSEFVTTTYDSDDGNANGFVDIVLATPLTSQAKTFIIPHPPYLNQSNAGVPGVAMSIEGLGGTWEILNGTTIRCRFKDGAVASGGGNVRITYSAYVVEWF